VSLNAATSTVVKNKSTERNREFWSHVETIAEQSRTNRTTTSPQHAVPLGCSKTRDGASVIVDPAGSVKRTEGE
jgi:hypothetical protein